jgi:hypothetical protein
MSMPVFARHRDEAEIIGRLLVGYGELEFMLAICAGKALGDDSLALRTIFRLRSEASRIDTADSILHEPCTNAKLAGEYAETLGAIRWCNSVRNLYAHCHWNDFPGSSLYLTNLQVAAEKSGTFIYVWTPVILDLLHQQEDYFDYTLNCLWHLDQELEAWKGTRRTSAFPMPKKLQQPLKQNLPPASSPPLPKSAP